MIGCHLPCDHINKDNREVIMLPAGYVPMSLDYFSEYRAFLKMSAICTADVSFANLWGWAEHYGLGLSFRNNLCWICQTKPYLRYWAPVGDWENASWQDDPELQSGGSLVRVPEQLKDILVGKLGDRVTVHEDRDQWEYLYNRDRTAYCRLSR